MVIHHPYDNVPWSTLHLHAIQVGYTTREPSCHEIPEGKNCLPYSKSLMFSECRNN